MWTELDLKGAVLIEVASPGCRGRLLTLIVYLMAIASFCSTIPSSPQILTHSIDVITHDNLIMPAKLPECQAPSAKASKGSRSLCGSLILSWLRWGLRPREKSSAYLRDKSSDKLSPSTLILATLFVGIVSREARREIGRASCRERV